MTAEEGTKPCTAAVVTRGATKPEPCPEMWVVQWYSPSTRPAWFLWQETFPTKDAAERFTRTRPSAYRIVRIPQEQP